MRLAVALATLGALASAGPSAGRVDEAHMARVQSWFQDGSWAALNSSQLLELVPTPAQPESPWAYNRFTLTHLVDLIANNVLGLGVAQEGSEDPDCHGPLLALAQTALPSGDPANIEFKLGEALYYGLTGCRDLDSSFAHYLEAAKAGHPAAQFMVGLAYSTGLFGNLDIDQALATLYYTFAADAGDVRAQIAVGYRAFYGIAGPRDYAAAQHYYEKADKQAMDYYRGLRTGIGFRGLPYNSWVISDESGNGLFGVASVDEHLCVSPLRQFLHNFDSIEDGLSFLEFNALEEASAVNYQSLAQVYNYGVPFGNADNKRAVEYARRCLEIAEAGDDAASRTLSIWAHAFLGERYLRGEGVPFDPARAAEEYNKGIQLSRSVTDCSSCYNGLGLIYLDKFESSKTLEEAEGFLDVALDYFQKGAKSEGRVKGSAVSQYFLAYFKTMTGEYDAAIELLGRILTRSPLANHLLPKVLDKKNKEMMQDGHPGHMQSKKCAEMYRTSSMWIEELHSPLRWAQTTYKTDPDGSLLGFLVAAELGYHPAQINIADALDVRHSALSLKWLEWPVPSYVKDREFIALLYYTRASQGFHQDALLKTGDYHFYGLGTPSDPKRAADIYSMLSRRSLQGMPHWILGWLHEFGLGVAQDYHLAKRYYDNALARSPSAYVAVKLSLLRLQAKTLWNSLWCKNSSGAEPSAPRPSKSFVEILRSYRQHRVLDMFKDRVDTETLGDFDETTMGYIVDTSILGLIILSILVLLWVRRRQNDI